MIEKLSADGKRITSVLASKPRTGRSRAVVVATGSFSAPAGGSTAVSLRLNSTGRMLRTRFKNLPAAVKVTATVAGHTTTIKDAKVIFGPDPPKVNISGTPATKRGTLAVRLRCLGLATQICRGDATITTFERLSADGRTITGVAYSPSGRDKSATIAAKSWSARAGKTIKLIIRLNATGRTLLSKLGRIPSTLTITYRFNRYTLTGGTAKITFKR